MSGDSDLRNLRIFVHSGDRDLCMLRHLRHPSDSALRHLRHFEHHFRVKTSGGIENFVFT